MGNRRVLVTGATGFLGSAVVRHLSTKAWQVRSTGRQAGPPGLLDYVSADLCIREAAAPLVQGVQAIVHVAGLAHLFSRGSPKMELFRRQNVLSTENLLRASAGEVRDFILISSIAVYGGASTGSKSEASMCAPDSPYGQSKLEAEATAGAIAKDSGIRLTVLRMATVYGEGDPGNCGRLMRSLDHGRFLWIGRGNNLKSLIYRSDAAEACGLALEREGIGAAVYNISAPSVPMNEIVHAFCHALDRKVPRIALPGWLARGSAALLAAACLGRGPAASLRRSIQAWLREDVVSNQKARSEIGFHPNTSLAEGVRRQVEDYRATLTTNTRLRG